MKLTCPKCFKAPTVRETQYGLRFSCCDLWSWGGPLVDAATHEARQKAHEVFDRTWKSGKTTRKEAYQTLSRQLRIPLSKCHIKQMNAATALRVIELYEGS